MKRRFFFENITSILVFAILGTLLSTIFIGLILYAVGQASWSSPISLPECLTFGALISSTV